MDSTTPVTAATQKVISQDVPQAITEVKTIIADAKVSGVFPALVKHAPDLAQMIAQEVEDIQAAIPEVKAGWRTSEFWFTAGAAGLTVGLAAFGVVPAVPAATIVAALAAVYAVVRSMVKA